MIRELQLSADQEDRIDPLVRRRISGHIAAEDTERAAEKADVLLAEAVRVLTPAQRRKWDAMIGKPLPTVDLIKAGPYSEETQAENSSSGVLRGGRVPRNVVPPPVNPEKLN